MKRLRTLPCSLLLTLSSVSSPRAFCSTLLSGRQTKAFWDFHPRIFLQFQLLTVFRSSGLPKVQTSRTSHCLMWLLQHLKQMCGPRISPPIQIHWPSKKWKPSHGERKLQSQLEIYRGPLRNNEQGISSYHKNIQMPKWMGVPKILGPYKPLVPVYETGELFELYSTSYEMWNCQNSHPFVCFTKCLGVDQQRRGWKRENYNTFPGFQMDRPVGSFEFNNCQLHQIMSTTTVKWTKHRVKIVSVLFGGLTDAGPSIKMPTAPTVI